jgi:predicted dehydrogenase
MQEFNQKASFLRVGFIGLGDHADEQLLPALSTIPNVELTVISSRNSEKLQTFANKFKPKFTTNN